MLFYIINSMECLVMYCLLFLTISRQSSEFCYWIPHCMGLNIVVYKLIIDLIYIMIPKDKETLDISDIDLTAYMYMGIFHQTKIKQ